MQTLEGQYLVRRLAEATKHLQGVFQGLTLYT